MFNISKVIGRKKVAQFFFDSQCIYLFIYLLCYCTQSTHTKVKYTMTGVVTHAACGIGCDCLCMYLCVFNCPLSMQPAATCSICRSAM